LTCSSLSRSLYEGCRGGGHVRNGVLCNRAHARESARERARAREVMRNVTFTTFASSRSLLPHKER
jgi:hypothetical protein